jgi:hypothetical protein
VLSLCNTGDTTSSQSTRHLKNQNKDNVEKSLYLIQKYFGCFNIPSSKLANSSGGRGDEKDRICELFKTKMKDSFATMVRERSYSNNCTRLNVVGGAFSQFKFLLANPVEVSRIKKIF